jgi:hypothetical protein
MNGPVDDEAIGDFVRGLASAHPGLFRLGQALCLAPYVATTFVRRARLEFVPASAAGLEADLWFSPLVESADAQGLVLASGAAQALRAELAREPERWARVRALTDEMQSAEPELARRYTRLAAAEGLGALGVPDVELAAFETAIGPDAPNAEAADDLSRWLVRFLPRLSSLSANSALARRLVASAATRLDVPPPRWTSMTAGVGFAPPPPRWSVVRQGAGSPAEERQSVGLGVRLDDGVLTLSHPPGPDARVVEVPGGEPLRVELAGPGADSGHRVEMRYGESLRVPVTVLADVDVGEGDRLEGVQVLFDVAAATADGPLRAVLRRGTAGTGTAAVLWTRSRGRQVVSVEVPADAELIRADANHGLVLLRSGRELLVQDVSVAFPPPPTRFPVVADDAVVRGSGRDVITSGPLGVSVVSRHETGSRGAPWWPAAVRFVIGEHSRDLVLADAHGRLQFRTLPSGGPVAVPFDTSLRPITAMTAAPGGWPLVFAQTGPCLVRMASADSARYVRDTGSTADITSLAVAADESATAAVDADGRLFLWRGAVTGEPRDVGLAFRAERVSVDPGRGFTVVGRGGAVELRTEDGRAYLLTPDRHEGAADPGWLSETLLGTMPIEPGWDPDRLRESGVGCVCLALEPPPRAAESGTDGRRRRRRGRVAPFGGALRAALGAGLRALIDVDLDELFFDERSEFGGGREAEWVRDRVGVLLGEGVSGVRVLSRRPFSAGPGTRVFDVVSRLRQMVDGHADQVLVLDRSVMAPTGVAQFAAFFDLTLDRAPGLVSGSSGALESHTWSPDEETAVPWGFTWPPTSDDAVFPDGGNDSEALLSLLVARHRWGALSRLPERDQARRLGLLVRVRGEQRALSRGTVTPLSFLYPEVRGTLHRHGEESVVCLANLGGLSRTVALTAPTVPLGVFVDLLDPGSAHGGPTETGGHRPRMITLGAGEYRWLRILSANELYASRA